MAPPSVEQEAEEEWINGPRVQMIGMDVEGTVSFEGAGGTPQSAVSWKISSLRNEA